VPTGQWCTDVADPAGGPLVCHNDVCLENIVFREAKAVALLDFDVAAPGRPEYDLAQFARMCVPVDDDVNAARLGWDTADRPGRLRLVADNYRLTAAQRSDFLPLVELAAATGEHFVRSRVAADDRNFVAMWQAMGGEERYRGRAEWWSTHRDRFAKALA
jgi:thiamine kinase-like enzyme